MSKEDSLFYKKIPLALALLVFIVINAKAQQSWVGTVNTHVNLMAPAKGLTSSPVLVLQSNGNKLNRVFYSDDLIVRVLPANRHISLSNLQLSLDGLNWVLPSLVGGEYQHNFGKLSEGNYALQIKTDNLSLPAEVFTVVFKPELPERVTVNLSSNAGINQPFTLAWQPLPESEYFDVQIFNGPTFENLVREIKFVSGNSINLTHGEVDVLNVVVRGCNLAGCGQSGSGLVQVFDGVPAIPAGLSVAPEGEVGKSFRITWGAVAGASRYHVRVADINEKLVLSTNSVTDTHTDITYDKAEILSLRVNACLDGVECSAYSEPVLIRIKSNANAPTAIDDNPAEVFGIKTNHQLNVLVNDIDPNDAALEIHELIVQPNIFRTAKWGTATISADGQSILYQNTADACNSQGEFEERIEYRVKNVQGLFSTPAALTLKFSCTVGEHATIARNDVLTYQKAGETRLDVLKNDQIPGHLVNPRVIPDVTYIDGVGSLRVENNQLLLQSSGAQCGAGGNFSYTVQDHIYSSSASVSLVCQQASWSKSEIVPGQTAVFSWDVTKGRYCILDSNNERFAYDPVTLTLHEPGEHTMLCYDELDQPVYAQSAKIEVVQPEPPVSEPDTAGPIDSLTTATIAVLNNDIDPFALTLEVADIVSPPQYGNATILNGLAIVYQNTAVNCNTEQFFEDSFSYRARNSSGVLSEPAAVTVTVSCPEQSPVAWSKTEVVVGEPVELRNTQKPITLCRAAHDAGIVVNVNNLEAKFYAPTNTPVEQWQCYDGQGVVLDAFNSRLSVNKLSSPQNLREQ